MRSARRKTILVAGGAGFLGSHLCDALIADGVHVICLDNFKTGRRQNLRHLEREPRFHLLVADVIEPCPSELHRTRISAVYNLASPASPPHYQVDPEHTLLTNVVGTRNLLTLAEDQDARFLLASTSEVYGDPSVHPQCETYWGNVNPNGPRACYDEGKRAAEALTFDFARAKRADVRAARIFNTYGPRMRADDGRVVSNVITQALSGRDITVYGDGRQTRSFCYVDDLVEGLRRLMRYDGAVSGPVNLGNPLELNVLDLAERVLAMTQSRSKIVNRPLPIDDPTRRRPDISLATALLGWKPRVSLDKGLKATIAWFAEELRERLEHHPAPPLAADRAPADAYSAAARPLESTRSRA